MRPVSVDKLKTGDRLGRDVSTSPDALPLLRAGVRISDSYRHSLERAGITSVWIDDGLSEGIKPLECVQCPIQILSKFHSAVQARQRDLGRQCDRLGSQVLVGLRRRIEQLFPNREVGLLGHRPQRIRDVSTSQPTTDEEIVRRRTGA